jgi:protein required for attachment to host cells
MQMPFARRSKDRASSRFEMRLSPTEREHLREQADLAGICISELVRKRALGRPIHSASDLTLIRELRRLGGLQKHMMNRLLERKDVTAECVKTIQALRAAVERVAHHDR